MYVRILYTHTSLARKYSTFLLKSKQLALFFFPLLYFSISLLPSPLAAQEKDTGWYVGLQGGVPFGVSTFSGLGADRVRAGYDLGFHVGYRFHPVLSLEAQAAWGEFGQGVRDCCAHYWLGGDLQRYEAPVAGMDGWRYADLKSRVSFQRYALQLNANLLGLFPRTRHGRWRVELSPLLAAVGVKSHLQTLSDNHTILMRDTRWHLGAGGNLQVSCRLADRLSLGLYSGLTWLAGSPLDALPEYWHQDNYIWETGVRLGFCLGRK